MINIIARVQEKGKARRPMQQSNYPSSRLRLHEHTFSLPMINQLPSDPDTTSGGKKRPPNKQFQGQHSL
jgi:hypothetical protein